MAATPPTSSFTNARRFLLRRILPGVIAVTVTTGWLRWYVDERGLIGHTTGVVLMTVFSVCVFTSLAFWAAGQFDRLTSRDREQTREDLYRLLARSYPDGGTFLFDRDLRYLLVEGSNLGEVGIDPAAFEGRLASEVLTPDEFTMVEPAYRAALAGRTTATEMSYRGHHYAVTIGPTRDERGDIVGGLVLTQQVTEQKALRDQFHQLQTMDAIGQFAGGIAHDFNNLLLGIRGYVELAQQHAGDARIERWLGNAIKVADEGSELTRRLLAFGRKEEQAPDVLDVNALVDDTRHLLERLLGSRISIVTRLEREPCRTRIERARMNQVLVNLAVNARDAMPDGGTLTIETRHVVVDDAYLADHLDAKPGPHVALAVSDTGTGMPQATVARIFEPFYTTKERGRGTGLGLSTVYGIVTQSGGHVTVSSELGKGTRFEVLLPADGSPVAGAPAGSSASVTSAA